MNTCKHYYTAGESTAPRSAHAELALPRRANLGRFSLTAIKSLVGAAVIGAGFIRPHRAG